MNFLLLAPIVTEPALSAGCDHDSDCPGYTACRQLLCINPCAEDNPCARTSECKVVKHSALCTCPDGYVGTPEVNCKPRKYTKLCSRNQYYNFKYSAGMLFLDVFIQFGEKEISEATNFFFTKKLA